MESTVRASLIQIKDVTYAFNQLRQRIENLEHLENDSSGREEEILMVNLQWMGGSQDKGEPPISHTEIETILNSLQECLNAHDNCNDALPIYHFNSRAVKNDSKYGPARIKQVRDKNPSHNILLISASVWIKSILKKS